MDKADLMFSEDISDSWEEEQSDKRAEGSLERKKIIK